MAMVLSSRSKLVTLFIIIIFLLAALLVVASTSGWFSKSSSNSLPTPSGSQHRILFNQGDIDVRGPRGEKGDRGLPGPVGLPGAKGEPGHDGSPGPPGPPGPPAFYNDEDMANSVLDKTLALSKEPGLKGERGADGPKGEKGPQGARGPKGEPGSPGLTGIKGEIGARGEPGSDGLPGLPGHSGLKGDKGERGLPGPPGPPSSQIFQTGGESDILWRTEKGERGPPGLPGPPGITGPVGERGPKGDKGSSGGPKGEKGRRGRRGPTGPPGLPGHTETRGEKGEKGEPGQERVQYVPGPPGPPGPPGSPGLSIIGEKGEPGDPGLMYSHPNKNTKQGLLKEDASDLLKQSDYSEETGVNDARGEIHYRPRTTDGMKIVPGAITFPTLDDMTKMTAVTALGTIAYIIDEQAVLVRINTGWQYVALGSVITVATETPLQPTETTENLRVPFEASNLINQPPQLIAELPLETPSLRLAALNEAYSGDLGGQRGADYACYRQARRAGLEGTFRAFLASRTHNLDSLVRQADRHLPVINIKGDVLFNSWKDIFSGNGGRFTKAPRIYSFSGKNILSDYSWPQKYVWHGGMTSGERAMDQICDAWESDSTDKVGLATSLATGRLLSQEPLACSHRFAVLCVEVSTEQAQHFQRKRRDLTEAEYHLLVNEVYRDYIP